MLNSRFGWTILLVGLALLGGAWIAYSRAPEAATNEGGELTEAPFPGYLAPSFTLSTIQGEEISLSDLRGRPVVLNFWATWCPPCRVETPYFQAASTKYNGLVTVLGIDQGEPLSVVTDFANLMSLSYPLLLDSDNSVNRQYQVTALPTTVFVDADGLVREVHSGIINQAVLEDRIERLMAESQ